MCLATRRDTISSMEEKLEEIANACYYFPGELFAQGLAHVYGQGMIAGREQALRLLRGESSQP